MNLEAFTKSFEQHSIFWFFMSSIFGGIVGASIKFLFEEIFSPRLNRFRSSRSSLEKLSYPMIYAADSLDRRLENFIRYTGVDWYNSSEDDYYRISTLYLFASFFGWCKILEEEAFLSYETSNKKAKEFSIRFYNVFKGLTSFAYFSTFEEVELLQVEKATVPRLTLTAIGELMRYEDENSSQPSVIGIVEFTKKLKKDDDFSYWFRHLDNLLKNSKNSIMSPYWNRIIIFSINLRILIHFLDKRGKMSKPRKIIYLKYLHKSVKFQILNEINKGKFAFLIDNENELFSDANKTT